MKMANQTTLMHAVLDGEASPDECRELERRMSADPAVRAEFEELRVLFNELGRIPQAFPPEGLVASVMQQIQPPGVSIDRSGQLSSRSGVFGQASDESGATRRSTMTNGPRDFRSGPSYRGENMSENKGGALRSRKVWIGAGVAVAAVLVLMSSGVVNFPPDGKDASGTIVPAQRYRAPQNSANDVKLGDPALTQSGQAGSAAGAAGAENAVRQQGTDNAVRMQGTENAVRMQGTDNAVRQQGTDNAVRQQGTDNAVRQQGTDNAVRQQGTDNAVRMQGTDNAARMQGTDNAVRQQGTDNAARMQGTDNAVRQQGTDNAAKAR